ncbi:hypothetical protein JOM56_003653 [Amanita muscaria]
MANRYDSYTRAPSSPPSEHAASSESSPSTASPVAVNSSSILSAPLSNIDYNRIRGGMEADTSDSDSIPVVPWNMRAGTKNAGGNTLVTQSYKLATSTPHLTHVEWRNPRSEPHRQRRMQRGNGKRLHKSGMSRDFFLLIALCIGLACALICLARPFITSILA